MSVRTIREVDGEGVMHLCSFCNSYLQIITPTLIVQVVASLDKALYDDYLCLVASNKQQIRL